MQLADLSDEGLGKLKPTARLSPKRKRALVMVSALCKTNSRGAFTESDLDQEVRWTAFTLGWSEVRYTLCVGGRHLRGCSGKELRANYPDHIIDVIAWWCGNEISGQWGCIPTRLAPGLAYRDPTVTTEAVAKKVRRSADALAALAGEPDVGFVKIIGQVEASLFQLHSAYDLFNDAMFAEFRSRGLQTQSSTPLVEKLEMYDSFHASEDERNRQVFQSYNHNTLNVTKSEWLAEKLSPAVHALLVRYKHQETGEQHDPIVEETFAKWHEEKELILNPKVPQKPKHRIVTDEDRLWEAPDVAKAEDLAKVILTPPEDKAIRKDVPVFGPSTDVSAIDGCLYDVVTQDDEGRITYEAPGTVALVDDGEYNAPIPSSIGRIIEPAPEVPKPPRKSDRDEDAIRKQMFVDQSAPQGAASVPGRLPSEYFYNGAKHLLMPLNPEEIVGDKNVKFNHGDLKFLSMLLRGHELEDHPLKFDAGCWTDVDALLDHFNQCRERRWGIRQLLRAAKADKKGRIRLQGIDIPMREAMGNLSSPSAFVCRKATTRSW